jgi:uncharacterized protein (TIGR04168 family)
MAAMLPANFRAMAMKPHFRVAVLGDAHGDFLDGECAVLERVAKPDLFLAVGDFDNESLEIIRRVASATKDLSGAAHLILGNHDAWRSSRTGTVSKTLRAIRDAVSPDLDVAYRRVEVPSATGVFSLVGARPLSWGGGIQATTKKSWALLKDLYGVSTPEESTGVITDALLGAVGPAIVVAHQGPAGLGEEAASICGKDWIPNEASDFGDDDLRDSLASARSVGIPLCCFGHMHAPLRFGGRRRMVCESEGTVYVNAAEVPRHRQANGIEFHYTIVDFGPGDRVDRVAGVWLSEEAGLVDEEVLWRRE